MAAADGAEDAVGDYGDDDEAYNGDDNLVSRGLDSVAWGRRVQWAYNQADVSQIPRLARAILVSILLSLGKRGARMGVGDWVVLVHW